jgi:hypothetical protein
MTERKLTAKLSDGTEWEVRESEIILAEDGKPHRYLVPIAKSSPPKEVWAWIQSNGKVCGATEDRSAAESWTGHMREVARYVLAEDLKGGAPLVDAYRDLGRLSRNEPKVYHLHFRRNGKLLRVLGPIENGKAALLFEDQEHKDEYADEVVRVRQSKL